MTNYDVKYDVKHKQLTLDEAHVFNNLLQDMAQSIESKLASHYYTGKDNFIRVPESIDVSHIMPLTFIETPEFAPIGSGVRFMRKDYDHDKLIGSSLGYEYQFLPLHEIRNLSRKPQDAQLLATLVRQTKGCYMAEPMQIRATQCTTDPILNVLLFDNPIEQHNVALSTGQEKPSDLATSRFDQANKRQHPIMHSDFVTFFTTQDTQNVSPESNAISASISASISTNHRLTSNRRHGCAVASYVYHPENQPSSYNPYNNAKDTRYDGLREVEDHQPDYIPYATVDQLVALLTHVYAEINKDFDFSEHFQAQYPNQVQMYHPLHNASHEPTKQPRPLVIPYGFGYDDPRLPVHRQHHAWLELVERLNELHISCIVV